jgi:hypothetical protein
MGVVGDSVIIEIENSNSIFTRFEHDGLAVAEHSEGVDIVLEIQLKEYLSCFAAMHQHILPLAGHAQKDEGLLERRREEVDLEVSFGQFDRVVTLQQHRYR